MLYFARYSAGICAAAILSGCNGSAPPLPAPGVPAQARAARSWMSPAAKAQNLLYVADLGTNLVDVYPYPKGKLVGQLSGIGAMATLCADKAGDVFVVDEAGPVRVYAHGGTTPIRQLDASGAPNGCSVDPVTGNLALTNQSSYLYGTIAIYAKAKGKPKSYFDETVDATFFCGYDDKGNLFIDGWDRSAHPIFLQMPRGKQGFNITRLAITTPGGLEWDGKYVAISDRGTGKIVRTNATGDIKATVKLHGGGTVDQFWIQGSTLIGPNAAVNGTVPFWHYPDGGAPTSTLKGSTYPIGTVVSLAH
jgi:hypothetical protein